jgi:hypothetical protein
MLPEPSTNLLHISWLFSSALLSLTSSIYVFRFFESPVWHVTGRVVLRYSAVYKPGVVNANCDSGHTEPYNFMRGARIFYSAQQVDYEVGDWRIGVRFPKSAHFFFSTRYGLGLGYAVAAVGWGTALQAERSRFRFPMRSLEFFIDLIIPAALRSTQRLTEMSTRNICWRGKGGWCVELPPS